MKSVAGLEQRLKYYTTVVELDKKFPIAVSSMNFVFTDGSDDT